MRVVVVGFVESIHAVRAVEPMTELGWEVHVVASHPHWANVAWRGVTLHVDPGFDPPELDSSVSVQRLSPPRGDPEPVVEGLSQRQRAGALAGLIEELEPDLIDSMEIQHGGYLTLEARELVAGEPPPWLVHNWGSDIFYYGRNRRHLSRLRGVLAGCDYYGAECYRDVGFARAFGFTGRALPVLPNAGGLDLGRARSLRAPGPTSERRTIALKASETFVYRPGTALDALERCADLLEGHTLALYTASEGLRERADRLCAGAGAELEVVSTIEAPVQHEEILAMHGRARASISLGVSDAICTAFLEAMTMGSFPIQSDSGCADAWAEQGRGAAFVDAEDVDDVAAALRRALTDDRLVDEAATSNAATVAARLDREILLARAMDAYERVAAELSGAATDSPGLGFDADAMAARLLEIVPPEGRPPPEASQARRELLALRYLGPAGPASPKEEELAAASSPGEAGAALAADLLWVLERQAEQGRAERVGWARSEVAAEEEIGEWHDSELIQRDAHIASLREHVGEMQRSLDGFHRSLQAATGPSLRTRAARRLLPDRLRLWAHRRAPRLMARLAGRSGEGG
jgi:hypothetical protein